ncbi:MAG: hypothetical protein JW708_02115 [Vallitaleaceae bacterium]|nr:hypothetical protein [Vallitaleaceae bacterium]
MMDQNIQKALWIGVSIMMFVAIVSTGLFLFNKGKGVAESSGNKLDDMAMQLSMVEYEKYDNMVVSGSDLVNTIKNYKTRSGEFIVVIQTAYPSTTQYVSSGTVSSNVLSSTLTAKSKAAIDSDIQAALNETSSTYINPFGDFMTQLIYDANDVVKGIVAIQQ